MTDEELADKYAEEYFGKKSELVEVEKLKIYTDGCKDGYNKAKEDADKMKSRFLELCNLKDMRIEKLEKANEWHYCKDELPDHNGQFYVALKGQTETFILNYDYDEYDESKMVWLDNDDTNFDDEVYAWCEKLKAPKENE